MFSFLSGSEPTEALVAVTYKCNAKCVMCNIWKETPSNELVAEEFAKLPKSLKDINITGGEPFLRNDLVEIIEHITKANPKVRIVISSNGLLTDRIVDFMQKIKKINSNSCIALSLDGLGKMHDEIRGMPKAYDRVIQTISELKKAGINDIRVSFTAGKDNTEHLSKVYDLSQSLGIEFTLSIVHNSENYFSIETNQTPDVKTVEKHINYVVSKEFKHLNPRRLFRVYFMKEIINFMKKKLRPLSCQALRDFFFLDPQGNIFPCNMLEQSIGNIREQDFNTIWNSSKKDKLRTYCENCNDCWMVCTAKSSIRREFVKVTGEIVKDIIPAEIKALTV